MGKKLKITGEFCSVINFAMQQNHVPVVRRLRITNLTEKPLQNISVHITSDPQMIAPFTTEITQLSPGQTMELSPLPLSLIPSFLLSLTERVEGTIMVTASQGDEQLDLFSKDIALLAYDEWSGLQIMPEITAAFVTPNHPYVADLVKDAASIGRRPFQSNLRRTRIPGFGLGRESGRLVRKEGKPGRQDSPGRGKGCRGHKGFP